MTRILAPLTFISVFGYTAQLAMFQHHNIAISDEKIVHVDQELKFLLPIKAGDRLYCDVYVHSIRQSFGTDIIVTQERRDERQAAKWYRRPIRPLRAGREDGEEGGFNDGTA